ncbi:cell division ATPase MinD [Methanolobus sp. ZRKC3]|uniref:cell division ATPase MinD n=1 Tax=Methanolobus sp. ZRKC3 TaxID=3125786 RepID=UPI003243AE54
MTAKIYAIVSGKGGTGSTTATINLGASLAGFAKKTLIIDSDIGMPNVGLMLGIETTKATLHDVLTGVDSLKDAIYDGPNNLKIIPGSISLQSFLHVDSDNLDDIIEQVKEKYEFILIDAPTGINKTSLSVLSLADEVIQVMNPDIASLAGAMKMKAVSESMHKQFKGIIVNKTGVIANEMSGDRIENTLGLKILEFLPEDVNVKNSVVFKAPIVVKYPGSPFSVGINKLSAEMAGIKVPAVETFVEEKKSKSKMGNRFSLSKKKK